MKKPPETITNPSKRQAMKTMKLIRAAKEPNGQKKMKKSAKQ